MNVYVYPADTYGCGYYRLIWPALAVNAAYPDINVNIVMPGEPSYIAAVIMPDGSVSDVVAPPDADLIVMQRPSFPQLAKAIPHFRRKGIAVVVDIDDDLAHIDPGNPAWLAMHPDQEYKKERYAEIYRQAGEIQKAVQILAGFAKISPHSWKEVEYACKHATLVTVSSDALAQVYGSTRTKIIHNYVPEDFLNVPRVDCAEIGWAGSTHSHPGDLSAMGDSIRRLEKEGISFMVIGNGDGAQKELGLTHPVPSSGPIDFNKWISGVAQIGVGVAPLRDTRFNRGKSWLKPLEYSAAGVPWVASALPEYRSLQSRGVGFIAKRDRDWYRLLKMLATNPRLREEQSHAGREMVKQMTIEGNAWRWAEAWTSALAAQRGAVA